MTGSSTDCPNSGRARETTPRQDCEIRLAHLRDRFHTVVQTAMEKPGRRNNRAEVPA